MLRPGLAGNRKLLARFSAETGIRDGKVEALVAGLDALPMLERAIIGGATGTIAVKEPVAIGLQEIGDAFDSLQQRWVYDEKRAIERRFRGVDWGTGKPLYSRIYFHIPKREEMIDEFRKYAWEHEKRREAVEQRKRLEQRKLYGRKFTLDELLSIDGEIPHEE